MQYVMVYDLPSRFFIVVNNATTTTNYPPPRRNICECIREVFPRMHHIPRGRRGSHPREFGQHGTEEQVVQGFDDHRRCAAHVVDTTIATVRHSQRRLNISPKGVCSIEASEFDCYVMDCSPPSPSRFLSRSTHPDLAALTSI